MRVEVNDPSKGNQNGGFRKGDIVRLKDGENIHPLYKGRIIIVTEDMGSFDTEFHGFCLIDLEETGGYRHSLFDLFTGNVTLSN